MQNAVIEFPLAYAKKVIENEVNKAIKQEIKRRLNELVFDDFSELETSMRSRDSSSAREEICSVLEAFKALHPEQHQLVVWHELEGLSHQDISMRLYGSCIGRPYDRTRQKVCRATAKFTEFARIFFGGG